MIDIDDAEILDILPYTMKEKYKPLSLALKRMRVEFLCSLIHKVILWADIDNAPEEALDTMAAEIDAPFYSSDMSVERKRAVIKATDTYNSGIGTVSSVAQLLTSAFGGGEVKEWYEYGGEPYHFRFIVKSSTDTQITQSMHEMLTSKICSIKPVRAKLDELIIKAMADCSLTALLVQPYTECSSTIKHTLPKAESVECSQQVGIKIIEQPKKVTIYPARSATAGYRL